MRKAAELTENTQKKVQPEKKTSMPAKEKQKTNMPAGVVQVPVGETTVSTLDKHLSRERILEGQASQISEDAVLRYPDILSATHEFTTILHFGSSQEMVEWLSYQKTLAASRMAAENADR